MFADFSRKSLIRSQRFLAKSPETYIPSFFGGQIRILRQILDLPIFFWMINEYLGSILRKVRKSEIGLFAESPKISTPSFFGGHIRILRKISDLQKLFWMISQHLVVEIWTIVWNRTFAESPKTSTPSCFGGHIRILHKIPHQSIFFWRSPNIWGVLFLNFAILALCAGCFHKVYRL